MSRLFRCAVCVALSLFATASLGAAEVSYELDANYSYVGSAHTRINGPGTLKAGDVSEQSSLVRLVASPQLKEGLLLRIGAEWQRYSFGLPAGASLPNTLQSTSLVLGFDALISDSWLMRVDATPGFYSNFSDLNFQDFNVPVVIGGSYIASADLQWVAGLYINANSRYLVLPGAGVRWKFANQWTLNAILPTPRLEYEYSNTLTIYGGAEVREASYRVDNRFGTANANRRLNAAVVDYTEIRTGVGASWKMSPSFTLELETGYMPYRQFDYHRASLNMETRDGAPYCQISISGRL